MLSAGLGMRFEARMGAEMEDLVSVIVPVYNSEKYIRRCLDSLVNQSYENIEIIIVNDGSTDASGEICNAYAEKDLRIRVIYQENGGQGGARNTGINVVRGEYIDRKSTV